MRARRLTAFVAATGLLVAACGGSDPVEPAAAESAELPATDEPAQPADEPVTESAADDDAAGEPAQDLPADEPADGGGDSDGDGEQPTAEPDQPVDEDEPATDEPATDEPATDEPADEQAPESEAVGPSHECSVDGSPTALESADGPMPEIAVTAAAAAASPLPELAVRRINCGGGWVQLKNEIPADLPLLIWFWAPH